MAVSESRHPRRYRHGLCHAGGSRHAAPHLERNRRPGRRQRLLPRHLLVCARVDGGGDRRRAPVPGDKRRGHDGRGLSQRRKACPPRGRLFDLPRRAQRASGRKEHPRYLCQQRRQYKRIPPEGGLHLLRRALSRREADRRAGRALRIAPRRHAGHQGHARCRSRKEIGDRHRGDLAQWKNGRHHRERRDEDR